MPVMPSRMYSLHWPALFTLVCGCVASTDRGIGDSVFPDRASTLSAPEETELHVLKLPNWSFNYPAPPGLTVRVPVHTRVAPIAGSSEGLPKGKTAADYNLPSELLTASGGKVFYSLGLFPADERKKLTSTLQSWEQDKRIAPVFVVRQPWMGYGASGTDGSYYNLVTRESLLVLRGSWPAGNLAAKKEVDEAIAWFIESVAVDPAAKKVDFFPGAGEEENGPVPKGAELAMHDGMRITATTPNGTIAITAGPGLKRTYKWEGASRSVIMDPRGERWHGSLGLYYPGPGEHWKEHNGITRGVVEEGQQHFASESAALKWLNERKYMPYVYTKTGLVVGWMKVLGRRQLNVEVWQILINGKKPRSLKGSSDSKVRVEGSRL